MDTKSVVLLILLVKICSCHVEAQNYVRQNSSHTSRYRDGEDPQVQMGSSNHTHSHHHHGHSHCTEYHQSSSPLNNTAENTELWMKVKAVPVLKDRNSDPQGVDDNNASNNTLTSKMARNANGTSYTSLNCTFGICESVRDYPADRIAKIISKSRELRQFFEDNMFAFPVYNRFGEDEPMCGTMLHWRFPQSARNTRNEEMLLVNVDDKYRQAVYYETCINEGSSCMYSDLFPGGFITTCTQKFTTRRLMAVEKESDQPIFDNFNMPSCCVCTIKRPLSP